MDQRTTPPQAQLMSMEARSPDRSHISLSRRIARLVTRTFTWGLPEQVRREHLVEADADWEAMEADYAPRYIALRTLRGIPAWMWTRLTVRNTTTLPAALEFIFLISSFKIVIGSFPICVLHSSSIVWEKSTART